MQNYYLEAKKTDILNNCFHELGWHNSVCFAKSQSQVIYMGACCSMWFPKCLVKVSRTWRKCSDQGWRRPCSPAGLQQFASEVADQLLVDPL